MSSSSTGGAVIEDSSETQLMEENDEVSHSGTRAKTTPQAQDAPAESNMPTWAMDNRKCAVCGEYCILKDEIHVGSTAIIGAEQLLSGQIRVDVCPLKQDDSAAWK